MMITHDLGVIAETCDAVSVMYAGSVVETGSLEQVLGSPRMPYTIGLLHSIPGIKEEGEARTDLPIIPGQVPPIRTPYSRAVGSIQDAHSPMICAGPLLHLWKKSPRVTLPLAIILNSPMT